MREQSRVERHFLRVEAAVGERSVRALSPLQRLNRRLLLAELARYRRARRFPLNLDFRGKLVPYFIDEVGTRCAVAHLLEVSGESELMHKIARRRNHARVRELADERGLVRWLAAAGLTLEEAALIQPSYCEVPLGTVAQVCCMDNQAATLVEATLKPAGSLNGFKATITAIYGAPLQDITIGFDILLDNAQPISGLNYGDTVLLKEVAADVSSSAVIASYPAGSTEVACEQHEAPHDALINALVSGDDCPTELAALGSEWQADSGLTKDVAGGTGGNCGGEISGCYIGHAASNASPLLASATLLVALLAQRRRRRALGATHAVTRRPR